MDDEFGRIWFRLLLQPAMAAFLAVKVRLQESPRGALQP